MVLCQIPCVLVKQKPFSYIIKLVHLFSTAVYVLWGEKYQVDEVVNSPLAEFGWTQ